MIAATGEGVAELTGLEPATSRVTGERSNQLNYGSICVKRFPATVRSFAELKPIKLYICTVDALDPN